MNCNRSASKPILRAVSLGKIDRFATMPSRSPAESFHYVVTGLLRDWQQQNQDRPTVVTFVGDHWYPRSHELRDEEWEIARACTSLLAAAPRVDS
jgi:hypothetical protein